jgi:hypothetical protein
MQALIHGGLPAAVPSEACGEALAFCKIGGCAHPQSAHAHPIRILGPALQQYAHCVTAALHATAGQLANSLDSYT